MSIPATVCPLCAMTVPTHTFESHLSSAHDPVSHEGFESFEENIDGGKDVGND